MTYLYQALKLLFFFCYVFDHCYFGLYLYLFVLSDFSTGSDSLSLSDVGWWGIATPLQQLMLNTLLVILAINLLLTLLAWQHYSKRIATTLTLGSSFVLPLTLTKAYYIVIFICVVNNYEQLAL